MPVYRRARTLAVGALIAFMVGAFSIDYTVVPGDTLGEIARDHDVALGELIEVNEISNPNLIYPGQVLVIPGEGSAEQTTHVVVRGDTLGEIAAFYGASVSVLVEVNGIRNPNLIRIGQDILVPAQGPSDPSGSESSDTSSRSEGSEGTAESQARSGRFHIVKAGEQLETIAAQYSGVSAPQIAEANGILDGKVYRGTRLFLDGPSRVASGTQGETTYRIQRGDRLADIAIAYDVSTSTLVEINGISNPDLIRSGDTLIIPTGTHWVCPLENSTFFNDWGFPRGGGTRYHEGNDLFTKHGAPVYAPVSGTVEHVTGSIGGKQFNLLGDDGLSYLGSHLSEFGKSGEVKAGEVIGYVGNTGNAVGTSPHLHFGMYLADGLAINPYPTLIAHGCK